MTLYTLQQPATTVVPAATLARRPAPSSPRCYGRWAIQSRHWREARKPLYGRRHLPTPRISPLALDCATHVYEALQTLAEAFIVVEHTGERRREPELHCSLALARNIV